MSANTERRDFLGMMFGAVAAVGGGASLVAMKAAWDPLPSVKAAGFTTIDVSGVEENALHIETWRGKPIFILKKSKEMIAKSSNNDKARDIIINGDRFLVAIGLCTHLGCIPAYKKDELSFLCACHGATYDVGGINTKAPAPLPLLIPPFKIDGAKLVLGEEGPEYKKMKEAGVIGKTPLDPKA
jgi:ubiquinol-cytochrome c reductase iron-sulfur subunit